MQEHKVNVWLINTGWTGGGYGVGSRIKLKYTREMIGAALEGKLNDVEYTKHKVFVLQMPTSCPEVPDNILDPSNTWDDVNEYYQKAQELAKAFNANFKSLLQKQVQKFWKLAPAENVLASQ